MGGPTTMPARSPSGISAPVWVPDRLRRAADTRNRRAAMLAVARIVFFTGLVVEGLARPEWVVEVTATAVLP